MMIEDKGFEIIRNAGLELVGSVQVSRSRVWVRKFSTVNWG